MTFTSYFIPGFFSGALLCFWCIYVAHFYLSPPPVDGNVVAFVGGTIVGGVLVAGIIKRLYLPMDQVGDTHGGATNIGLEPKDEKEVCTRRGTTEVALELTDEEGRDFSMSLATRKSPPLQIIVERDGNAPDMSFKQVTARKAATLTGLTGPYRLIVSAGKIIVAERYGNCVNVRNLDGSIIKTIGDGQMEKPGGVALDSTGNIYVTSNHKLQKFSMAGELLKDIGSHKPGTENSEFNTPRGIVINNQKVYICDSQNGRIQVFDLNLTFVKNIISDVKDPQDIALDRERNEIYVCEKGSNRICVFNNKGKKVRQFGEPEKGSTIRLSDPHGIHIYDKYILVSAESINGIMVYDTSGKYLTSITEFHLPRGITSDENGLIYICEFHSNRIVVI